MRSTISVPNTKYRFTLRGAARSVLQTRAVDGGAYSLWLAELIKPTEDDYILQLAIAKTDFLTNA
jgi:hypothetical protein